MTTPDDDLQKLLKGNHLLEGEFNRLRDVAGLNDAKPQMQRIMDEHFRTPDIPDLLSLKTDIIDPHLLAHHLAPTDLFHNEIQSLREIYEQNFRAPDFNEAQRLFQELQTSPVADFLKIIREEEVESVRRAIESMRSPWLDELNALKSTRSLTELIGMGHALESVPSFDTTLTQALRLNLGDWRDSITWPETIFSDSLQRIEFYEDRGFDSALTEFPDEAFDEALDTSGLRDDPPVLVTLYGAPIPRSDDPTQEADFARANIAHDWLFRLETQIRQLIEVVMIKAYGDDWMRRRLPNDMLEEWHAKKQAEEDRLGTSWPLIAYADFTDYEKIICKKDNWREVFAHIFHRQESVRESFQRLYPIRICTMHGRMITHADELFMFVEVKRLYLAIGLHLR